MVGCLHGARSLEGGPGVGRQRAARPLQGRETPPMGELCRQRAGQVARALTDS